MSEWQKPESEYVAELKHLREELEMLQWAYKERGMAMQDTGDVVRSLYVPERKLLKAIEEETGVPCPGVKAAINYYRAERDKYLRLWAELKAQEINNSPLRGYDGLVDQIVKLQSALEQISIYGETLGGPGAAEYARQVLKDAK